MTIHHSDTVNTVTTARALIARNAAMRAVEDARAAWLLARDAPSEDSVRDAFRRCVLAARMCRKAADVMPPHRGLQMLEEAQRLDKSAASLSAQLVQLVEGDSDGEIPPP